jgi:transcriptional regulator with XRE-family HTH domain
VSKEKRRRAIGAEVARILREERQKQNVSMTELAQRAGLSQQMVSYTERQMRNPTLDTLLRMTDALNLELANVLRRAKQSVGRHPSQVRGNSR